MGGGVRGLVVEAADPVVPLVARRALDPVLLLRVLRLLRLQLAPPLDGDLRKLGERQLAAADGDDGVGADDGAAPRLRHLAAAVRARGRLLVAPRAELRRRLARAQRVGHVGRPLPVRAHRMLQRAAAEVAVARRPLHEEGVLEAAVEAAAQPQRRVAHVADVLRRRGRVRIEHERVAAGLRRALEHPRGPPARLSALPLDVDEAVGRERGFVVDRRLERVERRLVLLRHGAYRRRRAGRWRAGHRPP